jgi:hypothetical protein
MQVPTKRRKKRGRLYFSSTKALKTSRMGRKKVAPERIETNEINKVLDFNDTGKNATLSTVDESKGPRIFVRRNIKGCGGTIQSGIKPRIGGAQRGGRGWGDELDGTGRWVQKP